MTDVYVLKLVLTDHWFEEIKSGRKTHEYRICNAYWRSRVYHSPRKFTETMKPTKDHVLKMPEDYCIEFQKAYRKNAEKMLFKVKGVTIHNGKDTDLKVDDYVFDFELGERIR